MVAVGGSALYAQSVTTGALSGKVVAAEDRAALPGAQVEAVHVPTGTRYNTVTRGDGRFDLPNARAGGPYTVTARMDGFQDQTAEDIHVRLGQTTDLDFNLQLASITEAITVTGESTAIINSGRTGAASNVSTEAIETLPTISRGLEDFARTNPFFSVIPDNDADSQVSVAGRNNRYNNISIDGAVNNDLFGLSDSGVPGGQTQTTPISLDAIQELQLLVAPYDVRQGGFSGGSINAITRSGSNQFTGSVFYYTRDEGLVGDGPDTFNEFGTFDDEQYGFRLGGPIVRDKVFFFVNGESDSLDEPSGFTIGGATGQDFGHQAEATRFRNALMSQYGFDPGGFNEVTLPTGSDKAFVRFDFNLAPEHQLTVRHNFVDADKGFLFPSNTTFTFPSHGHTIRNKTNSTVGQLNSIFGSNLFNEARVNIQKVEDRRGGSDGVPFPNVTVRLPDGTSLRAGTEQFSTANELDQDILAITDDVTWLRGDHTFTFGTHNELFSFRNLFIRDNFGTYIFNSLDDLERGVAFQLDHSFSLTDDPQQAAEFDSYQLALYASDQWQVRSNLTFTFGLRMDLPVFPDDPSRNPQSEQFFGLRTDETPSGDPIFSPRFGFNWDPENTGRSQLRGGIGIFAGRTPFVWLSNQYSNTGIEFGRLRATGQIPFNPDPFNQPRQVGSLFTNEIDLIDPDFKLPQIWRANVGYDRELGFWGLTGSVEVIHSQVIEDIDYQNLAVVPTGGTAFDGRPIFSKPFAQFTDVILLTNTSEGEQTSAAVKLERPFRRGLYGFASYVYTDATVINDGDSSQAISNWRFNETPGDPNNLPESTSDYEVEHRFNGALAYQFNIAKGWPTTVSLFYNAQSGRPYSTTFAFSNAVPTTINGDRETTDLIFVPNSADDVIIRGTRPDGTAATFADLDAYIELDEGLRSHRGGIVPRNASIAPWTHSMDLRLAQGFEVGRNNFEVTLDVLNLANLFDSDSGITRFVNFSGVAPIRYDGIDQATGKPIYTLLAPVFDPSRRFLIDDLRSRWRARLGVRWSF
jgi:hypothetical protein